MAHEILGEMNIGEACRVRVNMWRWPGPPKCRPLVTVQVAHKGATYGVDVTPWVEFDEFAVTDIADGVGLPLCDARLVYDFTAACLRERLFPRRG
jgi:hypothetical protein